MSRRRNQRVRLTLPDGREVWVTFVEVCRNGDARLGFDAPADVEILREEVLRKGVPK